MVLLNYILSTLDQKGTILGIFADNKFERMWNETVFLKFGLESLRLPTRNEKIVLNSVSIDCFREEV